MCSLDKGDFCARHNRHIWRVREGGKGGREGGREGREGGREGKN